MGRKGGGSHMKTVAILLTCLVLGGCANRACYSGGGQAPVVKHRVPTSGLTTGGQLYYSDGDVMTIWKQDGSTDYIYNQGR